MLLGLNRANEFHTIAEWAFLTDDPHLLAQRMWLLAKPALAQPTSAVVEFLARRTLAEVLKENTKWLTKKVNEKLSDGSVSEELIGRWLRDVLSDRVPPARLVPPESAHQAQPLSSPIASLPALPPTSHQSDSGAGTTKLSDLLRDGLLLPQDLLVVEGADRKRQTASLTADGKVVVAGKVFDSVSPAAMRALELAGKTVKAINGWASFRVLRNGAEVGSLLDIRAKYEGPREEETGPDSAPSTPEGPAQSVLAAAEQLKPLLALLPELLVSPSKSSVSLYAGNLLVGYAYPRKRGLPRLRVYVGETCPEWATPDPTYVPWCFVDDWAAKEEKVAALFKDAVRRRADEIAAGLDAYRRRSDTADAQSSATPE